MDCVGTVGGDNGDECVEFILVRAGDDEDYEGEETSR